MNNKKQCPRCGVMREARATATLCRDCRYVLTEEEIRKWNEPLPRKVA